MGGLPKKVTIWPMSAHRAELSLAKSKQLLIITRLLVYFLRCNLFSWPARFYILPVMVISLVYNLPRFAEMEVVPYLYGESYCKAQPKLQQLQQLQLGVGLSFTFT